MRYYCVLFLAVYAIAFNRVSAQNIQKMDRWRDSLLYVGRQMFQSEAEAERIERNFAFVKTLVSALKEPNSYFYAFDRLDMISVASAPDNSFRIFSWNIPLEDGSYLYYGTIQHKIPGGKLKLTPLLDKTFEIQNPNQDVTSNDRWYGAQYYKIIPISKNQFALLGWKGHHAEYTKKVIDILTIPATGEVTLGASVFSDNPQIVRKIFSYTKSATMYLQFNEKLNRIEFDHIAPGSPQLKDNFKYYGPDLTHDGYEIKDGRLIFKENIELHNAQTGNEDLYVDPLTPNKKLKSGL